MRTRLGSALLAASLLAACGADPGAPAATVTPPLASAEPDDDATATYVEWRGASLTVMESPEADELFAEVATCTSEEGGYIVSYPTAWYTNEGGEAPGCSWFGPQRITPQGSMTLVAVRPVLAPIEISVMRTGLGQILEWPRLLHEEVTVAGFEASRIEDLIPADPAWRSYGYQAWLDEDPAGLKLMAGTSSQAEGDYHLNRAVLDRMMTTLQFVDEPSQ